MDLGFLWKKLTAKILLSNFGKIPILDVGRVLDTSLLAVMFHTVHFLKNTEHSAGHSAYLAEHSMRWGYGKIDTLMEGKIGEVKGEINLLKICSFNVKTNSRYSFLYCFQGLLDSWEEKWANQQDLPLMKVKQSKLLWK